MAHKEARTGAPTNPLTPHHVTAEAVERRLSRSPYMELRYISCDVREGVLTLLGRVPSYYLKQLAQSIVGSLPGVQRIDNQLEVVVFRVIPGAGRGGLQTSTPAKPRPR